MDSIIGTQSGSIHRNGVLPSSPRHMQQVVQGSAAERKKIFRPGSFLWEAWDHLTVFSQGLASPASWGTTSSNSQGPWESTSWRNTLWGQK